MMLPAMFVPILVPILAQILAPIVPPVSPPAMTFAQVAPPPRATEVSAKAHAQILLREGTILFDRGEAGDALRKFEQAYVIFPSPKIWFDVGVAQRALDRPVEALLAFQRFLDQAPQAPAASRGEAQQAVAALMSSLGRLAIVCAVSGVEVSIDGKPAGTTPLAGPIWATPGPHQIAARREGMAPDVQDVAVAAGSEGTVTLALRTPAPPAVVMVRPPLVAPVVAQAPAVAAVVSLSPALAGPTAPTPPASGGERSLARRWWFWTAVGAVVAAGVVGVVLSTRGRGTDVPGTTLGTQGFP